MRKSKQRAMSLLLAVVIGWIGLVFLLWMIDLVASSLSTIDFKLITERLGQASILTSIFAIIGLLLWLLIRKFSKPQLDKSREQYPGLPVVNIMHRKKISYSDSAIYYIFSILIIHNILDYLGWIQSSLFIYLIFGTLLIIYLGKILLTYRIRQGFYANNRREVEEIIQFILDESSNIDFTDDGQAKKILSDKDVKEIQERIAGQLSGYPIPA